MLKTKDVTAPVVDKSAGASSAFSRPPATRGRGVRAPIGRRGAELCDLQTDPRESKNLVMDPKHSPIVAELKKLLQTGPVAAESPIRTAAFPQNFKKPITK